MDWFDELPGVSQLESAEDFLRFFAIAFDEQSVRVKHLHILHAFNLRLRRYQPDDEPDLAPQQRQRYRLEQVRSMLRESYWHVVGGELRERSPLKVYQRTARCFIPWLLLDEGEHR
ncbi:MULTISPECIES: nitrogenase-stabilizing/protective protein NifW [unclassified Brenneria]|uniref:nitrogenase-stabilizing/protective protein NifW n=1 Tax=unclassified Brenneria TaxID=2634434 RepID=UPI0015549CC3|nr:MULTISPECIES: nitrogenase-stabilizing/protective protein NifW [unclassified Brenneria]MBJ7220855.1 nitrogen fixation protein NifW [Brenneria sp. L3-3C-1]MEE3642094.1 nitrogenase-stabilizing/protective protein NifW [Brenneria sp. L3_3C_1]MEE3649208.1 nitrogenase-stabilizing/protective protein NifW [Brenneria sp. HEZEL_4_2_4]NPC99161.1 nitrogen fixation protein NifW [Brenneria sp. hezel4-2-4]